MQNSMKIVTVSLSSSIKKFKFLIKISLFLMVISRSTTYVCQAKRELALFPLLSLSSKNQIDDLQQLLE